MSTGTQNAPILQTFVVRIYRPRGAARSSPLSGTVETIPGGRLYAFDSVRQLDALLTSAVISPKKTALRRRATPKQPPKVQR